MSRTITASLLLRTFRNVSQVPSDGNPASFNCRPSWTRSSKFLRKSFWNGVVGLGKSGWALRGKKLTRLTPTITPRSTSTKVPFIMFPLRSKASPVGLLESRPSKSLVNTSLLMSGAVGVLTLPISEARVADRFTPSPNCFASMAPG